MKTLAFLTVIALSASSFAQQNPPPNPLGKDQKTAPSQGKPDQKSSQKQTIQVVDDIDDIIEKSISEVERSQLTTAQIDRLKRLYITKERTKSTPYITPAKPITRSMVINIEPGIAPPVIRLSRGMQTSIAFSDINAQSWFIKDVSMNRTLFSDGYNNGQGGVDRSPTNILTLEPLTAAAYGNVAVTMNGLSTPIIFILATAQDEVDMRIDAKIPGSNPDSVDTNVTIKTMPTIDGQLVNFLDGVPPQGSQKLRVSGMEGVDAWVYRENLYVRCNATAQYPAYIAAARSTTGVSVYRFASLHSSVTFLKGGQAVTVFLEVDNR